MLPLLCQAFESLQPLSLFYHRNTSVLNLFHLNSLIKMIVCYIKKDRDENQQKLRDPTLKSRDFMRICAITPEKFSTRDGLIVSRNYRMPIHRDFQRIEEYMVSNLQYRVSRYAFILSFSAENSRNSENSLEILKILRKF